jgi:hypothetical protein
VFWLIKRIKLRTSISKKARENDDRHREKKLYKDKNKTFKELTRKHRSINIILFNDWELICHTRLPSSVYMKQVLLPKDSVMLAPYIDKIHKENLHACLQLTWSLTTNKFWSANLQKMVKRRVYACCKCAQKKRDRINQLWRNCHNLAARNTYPS